MVSDNLGDFQTPIEYTAKIVGFLRESGVSPDTIIEPTFGTGNFIKSSLEGFENVKNVIGVEVQESYVRSLREELRTLYPNLRPRLIHGNIFDSQDKLLPPKSARDILIIGNPPWVTITHLSKLNSDNVPSKRPESSGEKGLDLLTGSSNFDIAESILTYLLETFKNHHVTIAMLCKTTVNQKLLKQAKRYRWSITNWEFLLISRRVFGVNVDAGLIVIRTDPSVHGDPSNYHCKIGELDLTSKERMHYAPILDRDTGWIQLNGRFQFVFDRELYRQYHHIDSKKSYDWRQGIKHDLSKVVVLDKLHSNGEMGLYQNQNGEQICLENDALLPFLKGSHVYNYGRRPHLYILATQRSLSENPLEYLRDYPRALAYVTQHRHMFEKRKSRVYKGRPLYSMFGVGEYSFAPYKVAIASMYGSPSFKLISPIENKPVLMDDTCYFISFDTYEDAEQVLKYLNSEEVMGFLDSIAYPLDKRKYKMKVLKRIKRM